MMQFVYLDFKLCIHGNDHDDEYYGDEATFIDSICCLLLALALCLLPIMGGVHISRDSSCERVYLFVGKIVMFTAL